MKQLQITKQITNRENDSLDRYLAEIGKVDLISIEVEVELARRIREGDQMALEKLTKANLRFVVSVAKQYQNKGLSLSDLINEGNLGLIKAGKRFDETRGFKFISYAVWWIRQCILQALPEQARIVRLPLNRVGSIQKISRTLAELEQKFQREPSMEEIAEVLNLSRADVVDVLNNCGRSVPIDAPFHQGEDSTMLDVLADENALMPDTAMLDKSIATEIGRILKTLSSRDAHIITLYFGLNGQKAMNLEEIGEFFRISRERVRQIKEHAVNQLRKTCRAKHFRAFMN
jgi:RNA polymerase primary sigma factor